MFAYVDETGNTGKNIFDREQPFFITAALITRSNFDLLQTKNLNAIAKQHGIKKFHARELRFHQIKKLSGPILKILKNLDARFFISRLEKRYLGLTKIADTIFDSGENLAVPWHLYNLRPLRMILVFKLAHLLNQEVVELFWTGLMSKDQEKGQQILVQCCKILRNCIQLIPDKRSQNVFDEAFSWIIDHPETIYFHSNGDLARRGHMPNLVAFENLMDGIGHRSKLWNKKLKKIVHDRQHEFEETIRLWHSLRSNAKVELIKMPGREIYRIDSIRGSEIEIRASTESAGIQIVDIVLWLFNKINKGEILGGDVHNLMKFVIKRAHYHDFSYDSVGKSTEESFRKIMEAPFTLEKMEKAQELINVIEKKTESQKVKYVEDKWRAG